MAAVSASASAVSTGSARSIESISSRFSAKELEVVKEYDSEFIIKHFDYIESLLVDRRVSDQACKLASSNGSRTEIEGLIGKIKNWRIKDKAYIFCSNRLMSVKRNEDADAILRKFLNEVKYEKAMRAFKEGRFQEAYDIAYSIEDEALRKKALSETARLGY